MCKYPTGLQILAVGANPGVQYEYVVPIDMSKVRYTWESETTECSAECGGGFQEVSATCVASDGSQATNDQCIASHKPTTGRFKCNAQPCPGRWDIHAAAFSVGPPFIKFF